MTDAPTGTRTRRPRKVLWGAVLVVLAWLVVAGLGGSAQGRLAGVQSNDNSTFLPESAESTLVSEAVAGFDESETLPYLVVVERQDGAPLTPEDLAVVGEFAAAVPSLPLEEL